MLKSWGRYGTAVGRNNQQLSHLQQKDVPKKLEVTFPCHVGLYCQLATNGSLASSDDSRYRVINEGVKEMIVHVTSNNKAGYSSNVNIQPYTEF